MRIIILAWVLYRLRPPVWVWVIYGIDVIIRISIVILLIIAGMWILDDAFGGPTIGG